MAAASQASGLGPVCDRYYFSDFMLQVQDHLCRQLAPEIHYKSMLVDKYKLVQNISFNVALE